MRTTVDIEPDLLERLRTEAHRRRVPFKRLLNLVIRQGLERESLESEPYECPTFPMGAVRASVDLDKALSVAAALEDEETVQELKMRK
jgi:hypothetical protein